MKHCKAAFYLVLLLSVILFAFQPAGAQNSISYQAFLTDSSGNPADYPSPGINMRFSLWSAATGGTELWNEIQSVIVNQGVYSVELGSVTPFSLDFTNPYYLQVEIDDGAGGWELLSGRQKLTHVPYALNAETVDGKDASELDQSAHVGRTDNPHGVTAAQTGAATAADLSAHSADPSAHHAKTTSFPELSGTASDAQIPSHIARDSEIMPTVLAGDGSGSGLDADTLDGQDSADFASASHNHDTSYVLKTGDTMTGRLTISDPTTGPILMGDGGGVSISGRAPYYDGTSKWLPGVPGAIPASGEGSRLLWYPEKAAFRAGAITPFHPGDPVDQWDDGNIGLWSFAGGWNSTASGIHSFAMGRDTVASGGGATALGYRTTASASYATALGSNTSAINAGATAMGEHTTASGFYSTATGEATSATGYASFAMGGHTTAGGNYSTASGLVTTASSYAEFVLGRFNAPASGANPEAWVDTDPLFVIGNGTGPSARSNAFVMLKNGNATLNGTLTATAFAGDGSGLTNLPAPAAHTHSGADITTGTVAEPRIDPLIARDSEITWSNLGGIPAGFADGIDNDTTYAAGTGLNLSGTTFNLDLPLSLSGSAANTSIVTGTNSDSDGYGVYGGNTARGNYGWLGSGFYGVFGYGAGNYSGVYGTNSGGNYGALGHATAGVYGQSSGGNVGYLAGANYAVYGSTGSATAGYFNSSSGYGLIVESGKVGIGTTSPTHLLDLESATGGVFMGINYALDTNAGITFSEAGTARWIFPLFRGWQSDNLIVRDEASLLDVMTFEAGTGRVGIGTSTPSQKLDVNGNLRVNGTISWSAKTEYYNLSEELRANDIEDVQLPNGARIVKMTLNYYDRDGAVDWPVVFVMRDLSSGIDNTITSLSTTGSAPGIRSVSVNLSLIIDNSQYAYFVYVNNFFASSSITISSVQIQYETTGLP